MVTGTSVFFVRDENLLEHWNVNMDRGCAKLIFRKQKNMIAYVQWIMDKSAEVKNNEKCLKAIEKKLLSPSVGKKWSHLEF